MSLIAKSRAVSDEYKSALADLTFNSKPLINVLTMLAEENIEFAQVIVQVICDRIIKVVVDQKMPALYLLDSILKNVGGDYMAIISKSIVDVFCHTFENANEERKRIQLFKLRNTWTQYIPAKNLYDLDVRISKTDPNWPVVAPPNSSSNPSPKVHINPKFLQKNDAAITLVSSQSTDSAAVDSNKNTANMSRQQKLLEEEKRVQEQLKLLQSEKIKREREQHELELRRQQLEREKLLAEQKRQLELLRRQQQTMSGSKGSSTNKPIEATQTPKKVSKANSELTVNVNTRDPRLTRQTHGNSSPSEKSPKLPPVSPKHPPVSPKSSKSALSVVNKIMTSVKKTKPSFVSSGASPKLTSFHDTHLKREQRNKATNARNNVSKVTNTEQDLLLLTTEDRSVSNTPEPSQTEKEQVEQEKQKNEIQASNENKSNVVASESTVPSVTNIIASVHNAVSIQAAALASAGPPPIPPTMSSSSSYSQLSSRDMHIAAQVAAIATVMTQMQSNASGSAMAPQQSAELAAKLIQLVAPPTSQATEISNTSIENPPKSVHEERKHEKVYPEKHAEEQKSVKNDTTLDKEKPSKEKDNWRIEKDGSREETSRKSVERELEHDDDEPPSKRSRERESAQEKSRKARARSPSRYHFRMERKIETEKRVEENENEMRSQRIRKTSEGDEGDYRPPTKRTFQGNDEVQPTKRDRKKEFKFLKTKLLDIQKDQREHHPSFKIAIVKEMRGEMNQKLKRGELTKHQYYELYEIIDMIQEAHAQEKEQGTNYQGRVDEFRGGNTERDFPMEQQGWRNGPNDPANDNKNTQDNWDRGVRRERPPFPRNRLPIPRHRPPYPREMPPRPMERPFYRERPPFFADGPRNLHPSQQPFPPDMPRPPFHRRSPNPPFVNEHMPPNIRDGPVGPHAYIGENGRDNQRPFFRGETPRLRMPVDHRPPFNDASMFGEGPMRQQRAHPQLGDMGRPLFDSSFPPHPSNEFQGRAPLRPPGVDNRPPGVPSASVDTDRFYDSARSREKHLDKMPPGFANLDALAGLLSKQQQESQSNSTVDVSGLLGKLLAAGVLEKKEDLAIPELKFTLDSLKKRYAGAVNQLFQGLQCSSCGHRFPEQSRMQYGEHLDWHFRQNRREKDGLNKVNSRAWYFDVKDWLIQTDIVRDNKGKVQSAFFEAERKQHSEETKETKEKMKAEVESTIPVLGGDKDGICDLCLEELEQYWDEEKEEWRYRKAVREHDKTFHQSCFEDYVPFELEETITTPTTAPSPTFDIDTSTLESSFTPDESITKTEPLIMSDEPIIKTEPAVESPVDTAASLDQVAVKEANSPGDYKMEEQTPVAPLDDDKDKGGDSPVYPPIISPVIRDDIKIEPVGEIGDVKIEPPAFETKTDFDGNVNDNIKVEEIIVKQEPIVNETQINISVSEADKVTHDG